MGMFTQDGAHELQMYLRSSAITNHSLDVSGCVAEALDCVWLSISKRTSGSGHGRGSRSIPECNDSICSIHITGSIIFT